MNKEIVSKIEYYLEHFEELKIEIEQLKALSASKDLSPTEVGYLVSAGNMMPVKEKTAEDLMLLQEILRSQSYDALSAYEYRVPCKNHVSNSSVCAVYGIHMSKCPLVSEESFPCEMYNGGYPQESLLEERFSQHLNYHHPELVTELAHYLRLGERPPAAIMHVLMNLKKNFESAGAKDYMNVLLGRNIAKKKADNVRKPFSTRERFEVLKRDNFSCHYCGRTTADGIKLHVDHVIPVAKGGTNDLENLVAACDECNLGKSDISL